VVCVTSGKGGVGKTTSAASFAFGLANRGKKTCVVDFDIGLRNLDLHLGMERRVIFDIVHVLSKECTLHQALIKDKRQPTLSMLAASQTRDKESLTVDGVERVLAELCASFDYVVLDSPAGIESGARHAMYFADDAILVTNPELSSCRDADKMVGFISSKSRRAELGGKALPVSQSLLITRYDPVRADAEECLAISDMEELLGLPIVGVIPESKDVLTCTNLGSPVIDMAQSPAAAGYSDMVDRFLGEEKELRFVTAESKSFLSYFSAA
jgi:septum site-determining protein MinD